jgi:outer membrane protein, heavy metal efflux system
MAPTDRHTLKHCAVLAGLFLAAAALLSGCVGRATREEDQARQDLKSATSHYRPAEVKPPLPALTEKSGLPDLIEYALLNNPRVEATFHDWAAAVEEITSARSLPDPMLTFGAEISRGVPNLSAAIMTDPMNNWPGPGKLPLRAEAAYGASLKKRALFENELLATALAVKRACFQMWVLEEKIRRTREILALLDDVEALARQRLAVGKVTTQDVLRAQMERDRLRNELANLEDSRKPLDARLRSALGLEPRQSLPQFALRLEPTPPDFTERSLLETAFARNPRLKEMRAEVLQALALFQLARKNTVPDYSFGVGATGGMSPVAVTPSVGITLPIWRDKIAAEVAASQGGLSAAQARLSAEELDLAVRFAETAYAWRESNRAASLYGERLLPKAIDALAAARAGYAAGASSFVDLQDAERMLLEFHLNHAEAIGQREMVLAEMSLIILGRWPENVTAVLPEPAPDSASEKQQPPDKH